MSIDFGTRLDAQRQPARAEATAELQARGFQLQADGTWHGGLKVGESGLVPVHVRLPERFPDVLPQIMVERSALPRSIPHIESNSAICIVPKTGILLDTSRPRCLVAEALERAAQTIGAGLSGANASDFADEFLAYWGDGHTVPIWSICRPSGSPRPLIAAWLAPKPQTSATKYLLADDLAAVKSFAARQGLSVKERDDAFFVPLSTTMHPPEFNRDLTYDDVRGLIEAHTATETYQSLICWLREARLPITLLLSMPLTAPQGQALIAVIVKPAKGEARKRALRGYRPDHVPAGRELRFAHDQPVTKLAVERFDPGFVLARGGATEQLLARSVAIVGCGAVGSHAVNHLAMLGIGNLRLVDPDILTSENIYRHVLGAAYVGYSKVQGLKIELERRLPQVTIEIRATDVEKVLRAEPEFIMAADLIVIAVGDETLERRLNAILADLRPRIHTWVEPLGIGGHVLATGIAAGSGCYDCLFENEATYGLVNRADLAAPGQSFQKSMAGCAGMYMPFAALDADRIASETARLVTRILTGQEHQNVLMGVAGDVTAFTAAGFSLSARGRRLREAVWQRETRHARTDCPVCGEWGS